MHFLAVSSHIYKRGRLNTSFYSSKHKAVARGGGGSEEPPQTKKGPPKGPLESMKRYIRMYKKVR